MLPQKKKTSIARLLFQLTLAAASALVVALPMDSVAAQSLAPVIPEGTTVRIDGSSSMATVNETLKDYIETQYPDTEVTIAYRGTEEALKALKAGEIDLAAIGRPLTAAEKAAGFLAYPLSRRKIAVVVSADNNFEGSLSHEQFARIFRGEIEDWSEIGGDRSPIRLIDRPTASDTRQAFLIYPIFQERPFALGDNAVQLEKDSTAALIEELDANAIGYTIADQAINRPELRILLMHNAFVTEESYPFSQPRYYAYRKDNPSTAVQSFLGLIASPEGKQAIESAKSGEKTAISAGLLAIAPNFSSSTPSPSNAATPSPETETTPDNGDSVAIAPASPSAAQAEDSGDRDAEFESSVAQTEDSGDRDAALPEETTIAQASPDAEDGEDEDDNGAIFWWVLAFVGILGLVWLWLNKQKAATFVKQTLGLPGQPPPIALAPTPTEPEQPSEPSPEPTEPTAKGETVTPPPVVPPAPAEPPKVEASPPPVVPPTPVEPPQVKTPPPPVIPPTPVEPPQVKTPPPPVAPSPPIETPSQPEPPVVSPDVIVKSAAIGAGAAAIAGQAKESPEAPEMRSAADALEAIPLPSNTYGNLTVNSKLNCYLLDANQLAYLESGSNTLELNPGVYVIRIESGLFNYWPQFQQKFAGEPWVLLWFYGGRFINKKTNLEVGCTWAALNGYDDTITLEVIETVKLSALFFDTYKDDNEGQITLSILKDE